ncbi:MAG: adenylate kinase [Nanoarchaeota archaeon]
MSFVFLGPPGVGKGLIAKMVHEKTGIPHISTGDLLRDAAKNGSKEGKKAREYMHKGRLVPDHVVIDLVKRRIAKRDCKKGFILDGFPRRLSQAKALSKSGIRVEKVIDFKASHDTIVWRIKGRRICEKCGAIYHVENVPSKKEDICHKCDGKLYQRDDDKPGAIKKRLKVYHKKTEPLIGYYKKKGILIEVETEKPIPQILKETLSILK